jgi:hypothetical protein
MPWAIVTGLDRYRYLDATGALRSARKGDKVNVPEAELRRATKEGWITPVSGEDAVSIPSRFAPPRDWNHRPSLWFIVPAWKRVELGRICLGHLAKVCAQLTRGGIDASAVVIAEDENLETARGLGFASIERKNMLGAKLNDGYEYAARSGIDYAVPIGTDDLVAADLIAKALPTGDTVAAFRSYVAISEDGTRLSRIVHPWEGGAGVRIWPVRLLAPCGFRPAPESAGRALDAATLDGVRRSGVRVEFAYHENECRQLVDCKSETQINGYAALAKQCGEDLGKPFEELAGHFPVATLRALKSFYEQRTVPAKSAKSARRRGRRQPQQDNTGVLVGMASIPERVESLERVVASLAPQAARLVVSLNGYDKAPGFLGKYSNVDIQLRDDAGGDVEKFAGVDDWEGYVLTADDDILYPPDYVGTVLAGIERYDRERIVSFHGGTTLGWNGSAVAASHKRVRCLGALAEDDLAVNVVGTGVMGFHASRVPIWRDAFRYANMADVQVACHARLFGVPMVCLAHEAGWLADICPRDGRRIYASNRLRDGTACDTHRQRELEIMRFDWRAPAPPRPRVRVSIATCGRPQKLMELLGDLAVSAGWLDIELGVYEDPADGSNYDAAQALCAERGWTWHRFDSRLSRLGYWRLVDRELKDARKSEAEWYLFLPDDVRLVRHAIPRALASWHLLEDPATLTLWRLQSLEGRANWTGKLPVPGDVGAETFHVDGLYLCRRDALEALRFRCAEPQVNRSTGSGVGSVISKALDRAGKRMYRVNESLVTCNDDGVSIMNPSERMRHPAVAL